MKVAYVRVSTLDQNEERQVEALKKYNIEKWYIEKISAKDMQRPKLNEMLDFVRDGDSVYILSFDRLARSTKDLLNITELFEQKNVSMISLKENFDTSTPTGRLLLTMIAAINTFERENILERQKEGIMIAKRKGKYVGKKVKEIKDFETHYKRYLSREVSKNQLSKELKISRPTLDRLIKTFLAEKNQYENE